MSPAIPAHNHGNITRHNSSPVSVTKKFQLMRSQSSSAAHQRQLQQLQVQPSIDSSCKDQINNDAFSLPLVGRNWGATRSNSGSFKFFSNPLSAFTSIFRSVFPALQSLFIPSCHLLAVATSEPAAVGSPRSSGRRKKVLTGTFFGHKKGRVSFAVQETPRSEPVLVLELATSTSHLVKEMASGVVRILLECDRNNSKSTSPKKLALWDEPVWTVYCNGHKLGYATSRQCTASDVHVLSIIRSVSVGAGVMPAAPPLPPLPAAAAAAAAPVALEKTVSSAATEKINGTDRCGISDGAHPAGQIMYMRAKFDRVIGSKDSEAFYMISPDCTGRGAGAGKFNSGGPELSIFLLRI